MAGIFIVKYSLKEYSKHRSLIFSKCRIHQFGLLSLNDLKLLDPIAFNKIAWLDIMTSDIINFDKEKKPLEIVRKSFLQTKRCEQRTIYKLGNHLNIFKGNILEKYLYSKIMLN